MSTSKTVVLVMYDPRMIAKYLNQKLQVGLTPDDILAPTAEISQLVFTNFVRHVLGVSEQSLNTLPLAVDFGPDQEMQRNSIPIIIVYQCMKAFIIDNSDKKLDLTMCDLVAPAKIPSRFRKLTSFLVDFLKFNDLATPVFNEISDEFSDRKLEMEALQEELVAVEKRKNELISRQNLRKRRKHELINEHNKLKEELNKMVSEYTENQSNTVLLNKKKEDAKQQIEYLEKEVLTGKKTIDHLTEEVLESPEELKQEMSERKKQIEELNDCLKCSRLNLKSKLEDLEICVNAEKNVPVVVDKITTWSVLREEILDLIDVENENLRKLKEMEEQLSFTSNKTEAANKRILEQAELHEQLRKQHLERSDEWQKKIEEITRQISAMKFNQPDVSREIEKKRSDLLAAKNAHSEAISRMTNSCKETMSKFRKIEAVFKDTQRTSAEKKTAGDRAFDRLRNACVGCLPSDYTFSTSSISHSENCDPIETEFTVFK